MNLFYSTKTPPNGLILLVSGTVVIPDKATRICLFLQPEAQLYFAEALKIYFQKLWQSIIEKMRSIFAKANKCLLGHPREEQRSYS